MKKTAFVLVGIASSAAAASAAPRLAAQESAASRSTESPPPPAPADNFDAWLDVNYGNLTTAPDGSRTATDDSRTTASGTAATIATAAEIVPSTLDGPPGTDGNDGSREDMNQTTARAERFLAIATRTVGNIDRLASATVRLLAPPAIKKLPREPKAAISYPLVDGRGDIMCANIATKGGSKRVCEDRSGMQVSLSSLELE